MLLFSQIATAWSGNAARRRIALIGEFAQARRLYGREPLRHGRFRILVSPAGIEWHGIGSRLSSNELHLLQTHLGPQAPSLMIALEQLYQSDLPRGRLGRAPFRMTGLSLVKADGHDYIDPAHPIVQATLASLPNRPLGDILIRLFPGSTEVSVLNHANWRFRLGWGPARSQDFPVGGQALAKVGPVLAARLQDPGIAAATLAGLADLGLPLRHALDAMSAALIRMG